MTLEQIISELHYTNEVEKEVLRKIQRNQKLVDELARIAYQADNFDFPLCKRMPLTRLSVVTYLLINKYDEYKAKGIPDRIIFDTFRDVSLRATLYDRKTSRVGISKEDVIWFRHIMNVDIFKIDGLNELKSLKIGINSFTKKKNDAGNNLSRSLSILNCNEMKSIEIGHHSFSDYSGEFELKNLPKLSTIKIDSFNFYYCSFVIKGIIDMILLMNRSSTFEFY